MTDNENNKPKKKHVPNEQYRKGTIRRTENMEELKKFWSKADAEASSSREESSSDYVTSPKKKPSSSSSRESMEEDIRNSTLIKKVYKEAYGDSSANESEEEKHESFSERLLKEETLKRQREEKLKEEKIERTKNCQSQGRERKRRKCYSRKN